MRRLLLAGVAAAALLLGGCGIPANSDVKTISAGPAPGPALGDGGTPAELPAREATGDPSQFVRNFLTAAAGDPDGAISRVKAYLVDDEARTFKPSADIKVIHLTEDPLVYPGRPTVTLRYRQVGLLRDGKFAPVVDSATTKLSLQVDARGGKSGLFVLQSPIQPAQPLLLSDTAFAEYYTPHPIYFWNTDYTGLVPDLRYMPTTVAAGLEPTIIVNWLINGPADWLRDAVQPLPQGMSLPDTIPAAVGRKLTITLNQQAADPGTDKDALDRLRRQLQWSLGRFLPDVLELRTGHDDPVSYAKADYLESNPGYRVNDEPERFVIYGNGQIRRLTTSLNVSQPIPVLKPEANKGFQFAALRTAGACTFAAVVTAGKSPTLRVAAAPIGEQADLRTVGGLAGALGRPVWAVVAAEDTSDGVGLIIANGKLYSFATDGSPARAVEWQGGSGPLTDVSVAPDGRRVILVSGGRIYRTVLKMSGDQIALGATTEQVLPPLMRSATKAVWSSEGWLTVAGVSSNNRSAIRDITVDGALTFPRLDDIGPAPVTYLTAFPAGAGTGGDQSRSVSYMADGTAWEALGDPVAIKDVAGVKAGATALPSAPFFLD
jgi:lipoprotein LpqB-like beta-propeller protein